MPPAKGRKKCSIHSDPEVVVSGLEGLWLAVVVDAFRTVLHARGRQGTDVATARAFLNGNTDTFHLAAAALDEDPDALKKRIEAALRRNADRS
jgi:hypothetical protein